MAGHQITMPWQLGQVEKGAQTPREARQTDAPSQPVMVGKQTASVVQARLQGGWERIAEARAAGRDVYSSELRWAALFARWCEALGLPCGGADDLGLGWTGYAEGCEAERRALREVG